MAKKIKVIGCLETMIEGTKDFEVFDEDRYIKDYENLLNKIFVNYEIHYSLDQEYKQGAIYPIITGEIDEIEKKRIEYKLHEEFFLLYFADHDYFSPVQRHKDEINEDVVEKNIKLHRDSIQCILNGSYNLAKYEKRDLTSVELTFLKFITSKKNFLNDIHNKWSAIYKINYQDVLNQYAGQNLIEIVPVLKRFATKGKVRYCLTEKGLSIVPSIFPSFSQDADMENRCFNFVINRQYEEAMILASRFREEYLINMNRFWAMGKLRREPIKFKSVKSMVINYEYFRNFDSDTLTVSDKTRDFIHTCIIMGDMFMANSSQISDFIFSRIDPNIPRAQVDLL